MNLGLTYQLYQDLQKDNLSFFYHGTFSDEITDKAIDLSDKNINNVSGLSKMRKKVSFLMAECIQNIVRHGANDYAHSITSQSEMFFTRNIDETYFISSANLVDQGKREFLTNKLEQVNNLDREGLKQLYLDILTNEEMSEKGGAGLGLVEMARKSGQKLDFDFKDINDIYSFFYLQIKLKSKSEQTKAVNLPVDDIKSIHKQMDDNKILMLYKGDFSEESVLPMLLVIEENLRKGKNKKVRKRMFHLMVEILQNISLHGVRDGSGAGKGILLIGRDGDSFVINAGNYIETPKVQPFETKLKAIKGLDKEELRDLYRNSLIEFSNSHSEDTNLGIVGIARDSRTQPNFKFTKLDNEKSFFSISVAV